MVKEAEDAFERGIKKLKDTKEEVSETLEEKRSEVSDEAQSFGEGMIAGIELSIERIEFMRKIEETFVKDED